MRAALVGALAVVLVAVALYAVSRSRDVPSRGRPDQPHRTIRYGEGRDRFGELWRPDGPGTVPVVVLIHGGFWREPYRLDLMDGLARDLSSRGFAAWNIEYRRVGGGGGFPATFDDVAAAIDHLAAIASSERLDLSRVVTVGHSAGGHLALWAASRDNPAVEVTKAISLAGVPDLVEADRAHLGSDAARELLGGSAAGVPDRYAAASPAARLPLGVPQVLVHGADDDIVPPSFSRAYAAAATAAGDDVELVELPGVDHDDVIDPSSPAWTAVLDRL
ncbi:MAG TPA: alpha/beta hydrolase [Acidimicrobiales bacterium]|nr:alpha/beta hydrolase [Acidimicrobiales bacterium]